MNKFLFLGFLSAILCFGSCQSETDKAKQESKLFIKYYSRYLQSDRTYRAEADFLQGDSIHTAKTTIVPSVSFQGASMQLRDLPGKSLRYKAERNGPFQADQQFKFKWKNGEVHRLDAHLDPIESFIVMEGPGKNSGLTIAWEGSPLNEHEDILIMLSDQSNKAATADIPGPTEKAQAQLTGDFLGNLENGPGTIYLVRKYKGRTTDKNKFINYLLEYYTSPIDINIVD